MKPNVLLVDGIKIEIGDDGEVTIEGARRVDIRHVFETTGRGSFFRRTLDDKDDPEHQMVIIRTDLKDIQKIGVEVCGMNEPWGVYDRPRMDVQIGYCSSDKIVVKATPAGVAGVLSLEPVILGEMGLDQYVYHDGSKVAKQDKAAGLPIPQPPGRRG